MARATLTATLLLVVVAAALVAPARADWDSLVGSINLDSAPDVLRYTVPEVDNLEDPHPVHGIEMSNGDFALVGKALRYAHSLTRSLAHSLTLSHSLTHSLAHSLTRSGARPATTTRASPSS